MKYREHNDNFTANSEIQAVGEAFDDCLANALKYFWKRFRIADDPLQHPLHFSEKCLT